MASSYFKLLILNRKRKHYNLNKKVFKSDAVADGLKCRICLLVGSKLIFDHENDCSEFIKIICGVEVTETDEYPKYICDECFGLLNSAIKFREKAQKADKILRKINIQKPRDDVSEVSELNEQSRIENKNINFSFNPCRKKINSFENFVHNAKTVHKNVRVQCPICFGLLTQHLYTKHMEHHQSTSHLICEVCGKVYRKDNLLRHLQMHTSDLPFQCQLCPYRGRFMESLKLHMRTHSIMKPYSCDKCEQKFITKSNLSRHLLTHQKERPFKCTECNRGFYRNNDMQVHIKSDHVGIKDYCCNICGNKYGTKKALLRHELRVHKRNKMTKGRRPLYLRPEYSRAIP